MNHARAWWALARPRLWPFVMLLPALGYGFAHWDRALAARHPESLAGVIAAWTLLHAGTLWLNACLDRDQGEVLLGDVVEPPAGTERLAYAALVLAVVVGWRVEPGVGGLTAIGALLAVAYSHPRLAWKGDPLGGPLVNAVGYGVLSPLAGWWVVRVDMNARTACVGVAVAAGVLGAYYVAQAFQERDDRARGYRTLVARRGPRAVLRAAEQAFGVSYLVLALLCVVGWMPGVCALGLASWPWLVVWLRRWAEQPDGGGARWAVGLAWRLGWAAVLVVALAGGEYVRGVLAGEPVAGLGTRSGHPADRPRLPPEALAAWEAGLLAGFEPGR
jgi:1,4-dihydroxy-2-naphthoate octaprenyltransferase